MLIGRERESRYFKKKTASERAELLVLYGRRRVGKTFLLSNLFPEALFFSADLSDVHLQTARFSEEVKRRLGLPATLAVSTWDELFALVENLVRSRTLQGGGRFVFVWDEFQYLPEREPAFLSVFQRWWDSTFSALPVTMILCSSFIGMMERIALSSGSPLYGRRTGQYFLQPLPFAESSRFLPSMSVKDRISTYSVTGGIPLYLNQFASASSFRQGLLDRVFSPGEFLAEEGRFLVLEEFKRDPSTYFAILQAVAAGRTRPSEIATVAGVPYNSLGTYLASLLEMNLVVKEYPFSLKKPKKTPLYFIDDDYLRFYFRYLHGRLDMIYRERGEEMLEMIAPSLPMHVSPTFEKICRQALEAWRSPQTLGRWWDSEDEVDIVAVAEKTLLTCECKWTGSPMGRRELAELQRRTGKVLRALGGDFETEHYLFSKSSFKGLEEENGLHLIDPERLEEVD